MATIADQKTIYQSLLAEFERGKIVVKAALENLTDSELPDGAPAILSGSLNRDVRQHVDSLSASMKPLRHPRRNGSGQ